MWFICAPVARSNKVCIYVAVSELTTVISDERAVVLVIACIICSQSTRRIDSQVLNDTIIKCVSEQRTSRVPILDRETVSVEDTVEVVITLIIFISDTTGSGISGRCFSIEDDVLRKAHHEEILVSILTCIVGSCKVNKILSCSDLDIKVSACMHEVECRHFIDLTSRESLTAFLALLHEMTLVINQLDCVTICIFLSRNDKIHYERLLSESL